jgi:pyruvate dehydrogenase E1 component
MPQAPDIDVLARIQSRVLWLATRMIHEANHVRPNTDGTKVGGHQASSASVVSILTALYFGGFLRAGDRLSVKPHASPVFHAIQYLLGNLDRRYLPTLRAFGGLQAYPSRTKD